LIRETRRSEEATAKRPNAEEAERRDGQRPRRPNAETARRRDCSHAVSFGLSASSAFGSLGSRKFRLLDVSSFGLFAAAFSPGYLGR
jgi:hypothetical protein